MSGCKQLNIRVRRLCFLCLVSMAQSATYIARWCRLVIYWMINAHFIIRYRQVWNINPNNTCVIFRDFYLHFHISCDDMNMFDLDKRIHDQLDRRYDQFYTTISKRNVYFTDIDPRQKKDQCLLMFLSDYIDIWVWQPFQHRIISFYQYTAMDNTSI